jgi:hypothetical protein
VFQHTNPFQARGPAREPTKCRPALLGEVERISRRLRQAEQVRHQAVSTIRACGELAP